MGNFDHGVQTITYEYLEEATAEDFNKRHLNLRPRGIYSGGYLTRVSDTSVTLSSFVAEIGDSDEQIGIQTASSASLISGTLDSGTIDTATPYLVLRWAFIPAAGNYVEVHAIATVAAAQTNDIIIGKCNFTGSTLVDFDYTDRTFLSVQDLFFKVETSSGMNVQLRAGRVHSNSASIFVPEQVVGTFSVPGSPNSRIDLVYIATDGTPTILQGTAAVSGSQVAPNYGNRLVVAEVTIVNGDSSIPASRIKDVRSFISAIPGSSILGTDVVRAVDTIYLAETDGQVRAFATTFVDDPTIAGYKGLSSPPATLAAYSSTGHDHAPGQEGAPFISYLVQKGYYWRVTRAATGTLPALSVQWTPIGN